MTPQERFILSLTVAPRVRVVHQSGDGSASTLHVLSPDGTYEQRRFHPKGSRYPGEGNRLARRTAAKGKARK